MWQGLVLLKVANLFSVRDNYPQQLVEFLTIGSSRCQASAGPPDASSFPPACRLAQEAGIPTRHVRFP
jgi:hypothetical protein